MRLLLLITSLSLAIYAQDCKGVAEVKSIDKIYHKRDNIYYKSSLFIYPKSLECSNNSKPILKKDVKDVFFNIKKSSKLSTLQVGDKVYIKYHYSIDELNREFKYFTILSYKPKNLKWKRYYGNNFSVKYPVDFKPRHRMRRYKDGIYAKQDFAYFKSPDGLVDFYVFAVPTFKNDFYTIAKKHEELIFSSRKTYKTKGYLKHTTIEDVVYFDRDLHKYYRAYQKINRCHKDKKGKIYHCETKVFGYKYANKEAHKKYLSKYLKFKKSVKTFSDY